MKILVPRPGDDYRGSVVSGSNDRSIHSIDDSAVYRSLHTIILRTDYCCRLVMGPVMRLMLARIRNMCRGITMIALVLNGIRNMSRLVLTIKSRVAV